SRGPRNLNTSAASSSPIDISSSALLVMPSAFIGHPVLDDGCDDLRILARNRARVLEIALEAVLLVFEREQRGVRTVVGPLGTGDAVEQHRFVRRRQRRGGGRLGG